MLFQVVEKFDTAQDGVSLPNILLTPRAPIHRKISWFLDKCISKHSSLLLCRYWVHGWSSYTGLTRSHPPSWRFLGLALCWPEVILEEWELHGGHIGVTVQHKGDGCLGPLQLSGGTGKLNTRPKLFCIVRSLHRMEIGCKSDDFQQERKLKGAKLKNWLSTPTVVTEEYTPRVLKTCKERSCLQVVGTQGYTCRDVYFVGGFTPKFHIFICGLGITERSCDLFTNCLTTGRDVGR